MTKTADIVDIQNDLADILALLSEGAEIILTSNDKPLARLLPIASKTQRIAGLYEGVAWMSEDFAEPLPDEFWLSQH